MRLAALLTVGILAIVAGVSARSLVDQGNKLEGNSAPHLVNKSDVGETANLATSLTDQEKKIVQSTWAYMKGNPTTIGVIILYSFFKKFPEYQQLFSNFKDVPLAYLPSNKDFQTISFNTINSLGNVIDSLNDPDSLKAYLSAIGERNRDHKITKELVQNLKVVILHELRQIFGPDVFTDETILVWSKTIDIAFSGLLLVSNDIAPKVRENANLVIGPTSQQKTIVQSTWANIKTSFLAYSVVIMYNYFRKYPEYQKLFPEMENVPLNDLPKNKAFLKICHEITTALGDVIESPDKSYSVQTYHSASGEKNDEYKYHKELLQNLKREILHVLRVIYAPNFTFETEEAWNKVINLFLRNNLE